MLLKNWSVTAIIIVVLGLGIGVNTAIIRNRLPLRYCPPRVVVAIVGLLSPTNGHARRSVFL
jgi:hypothetical protein